MASTINAQTTPFAAVVTTADGTGNLALQTANVTALTINTSQVVSLAQPLPVSSGGTGATTQNAAAAAVLPSQTSNSGKYLTTDGANASWATVTQTRISGGTTGLTPNTLTGGDVTLAGTLAVANGGTGNTNGTAAGVSSGSWVISISGTKILFAYGGVNKGSLDSSGNFIVTGNVTAYGTP
jgi:hypothetical protein